MRDNVPVDREAGDLDRGTQDSAATEADRDTRHAAPGTDDGERSRDAGRGTWDANGGTPKAGRATTAGIFLLTLFAYAYFFNGGGWNQNAVFDLTRAIVERGTLWIDGYHRNTGDAVVVEGHVYANKPPGVSLLAVPPYWVLHTVAKSLHRDPADWSVLTLNAYLVTVLICGIAGAWLAAVLYQWSRERTTEPWAVAIALTVALGTPLFAYSTMLFVHVPSALLTLLAFRWSADQRTSRAAAAGVASGLNALCNFVAIPLVLVFLARTLWRAPRPLVRMVAFSAGALPSLLGFAAYQLAVYGSIFRNPATMNPAFTRESGEVLGAPSFDALLGITISPYRGLFFLSPILIFAVAGVIVMFRRREFADAITICAVALLFLAVNISFNNWNAGAAFAPRYLLPALPLLGLAMAHVAGWWRGLFIALAIISVANNLTATAVDPQVPIMIKNPMADYEYPLLVWGSLSPEVPIQPPWLRDFLTGHTSVNRQSVDEILPLMNHAPDSAEAEWASFNAGEWLFGPGELLSLLPILLVLVAGSAGLFRRSARQV